jgi:hypothetical protein
VLGRDTDPDTNSGYSYSNTTNHTYSDTATGYTYPDAADSNPDAYSNPSANTDTNTGPDTNPNAKCDTNGADPQPLDSHACSDRR